MEILKITIVSKSAQRMKNGRLHLETKVKTRKLVIKSKKFDDSKKIQERKSMTVVGSKQTKNTA